MAVVVSRELFPKKWCNFGNFGHWSPVQPGWIFLKNRRQPDNPGLSSNHRRWVPVARHIMENHQGAGHGHAVVISMMCHRSKAIHSNDTITGHLSPVFIQFGIMARWG